MNADDLAYLTVDRQLNLFEAGEISPTDVLEAQLARIDRCDPAIRSITDRYDANARVLAAESDRRWRNGEARSLEGITVAVKEEQALTGEPLLFGSLARARAREVAAHDHPVVERIRSAGAIIHARTATPEYSAAGFTRSALWGETVSPWDPMLSAGGSSGGSGAALAAGFCSVATGSDVAGSLLIPASACGVVGFKPPYGSIAALPSESFDTYCHDGAMGRTVRDALRLHDALIGQHPEDFVSVPFSDSLSGALDAVGLSVGIARGVGDAPLSATMAQGVDSAAELLLAGGCVLSEVELPWRMGDLAEAAFAHYGSIMAPMIRTSLGEGYSEAESYTRDFVEVAEKMNSRWGHFHAIQWAARVQADLAALFRDVDVLVCPTGMVQALPTQYDALSHRVQVDGVAVEVIHHTEAFFAMPFNMASRVPVFAVPTAVRTDGPPVSVQVVGHPYDPAPAAAVAALIEESAGWYRHEAGRPPLTKWT